MRTFLQILALGRRRLPSFLLVALMVSLGTVATLSEPWIYSAIIDDVAGVFVSHGPVVEMESAIQRAARSVEHWPGALGRVLSVPMTRFEGTDNTRGKFQAASDALRSAFGGFARETKPVYTTAVTESRSSAAFADGLSARVDPFQVNYDVLQSRAQVNTNIAGMKRESYSVDSTRGSNSRASSGWIRSEGTTAKVIVIGQLCPSST